MTENDHEQFKNTEIKILEVQKEGRVVVLKGRGIGEKKIPDIEGTHTVP